MSPSTDTWMPRIPNYIHAEKTGEFCIGVLVPNTDIPLLLIPQCNMSFTHEENARQTL